MKTINLFERLHFDAEKTESDQNYWYRTVNQRNQEKRETFNLTRKIN